MSGNQTQQSKRKTNGIRIRTVNVVLIILTGLVALLFMQTVERTQDVYHEMSENTAIYQKCDKAAEDFMTACTYLTSQARLYVASYQPVYLQNYMAQAYGTRTRENSLSTVEKHYSGTKASDYLTLALSYSRQLETQEIYALKLATHALGREVPDDIAARLDGIPFKGGDENLPVDEALAKAQSIVTGDQFDNINNLILSHVTLCENELLDALEADEQSKMALLDSLLARQQVLTWLLLIVVLASILAVVFTVLWPLQHYITYISRNEDLKERGSYELRYLARAYNTIYNENQRTQRRLTHEAEHDSLTGLYNRGAFEKLLAEHEHEHIALIVLDVDLFKDINDEFGHDCGDRVLKRVAEKLRASFRTTDFACRTGGDEFGVIACSVGPEHRALIEDKVASIADSLREKGADAPATTLSVGVAFSDGTISADDLYKNADRALYRVKESGRNSIAFYGDDAQE